MLNLIRSGGSTVDFAVQFSYEIPKMPSTHNLLLNPHKTLDFISSSSVFTLSPRVLSAKPNLELPWRRIPFLDPFFADRRNLFRFCSRDPLLHLLLSPNLRRLLCSAGPVLWSPLFPPFSVAALCLSKVSRRRLHRLL